MKTYYVRFGTGDPRQYAGLAPTFLMFKLSNNTDVTPPSISEVGSSSGLFSFQYGTTTAIAFLIDAATTSPGTTGRYVTGAIDPADRTDEYAATMIAIGTSLVAIGTSNIALGISNVALGTTNVALGTTNVALGTTAVFLGGAIGTTLGALGSSIMAFGATNFALGTTGVALGTTNVALGTTNVAIGTSLTALGTSIYAGLNDLGSSMAGVFAAIGSTASSFGDSSTDPVDLFGYLKRIRENLEGNRSYIKPSGALSLNARNGTTLITKTITNSVSMTVRS